MCLALLFLFSHLVSGSQDANQTIGVILNFDGSYACAEDIPVTDFDNISVCFFLILFARNLFFNNKYVINIFTIKDNSYTIEFQFSGRGQKSGFILKIDEIEHYFYPADDYRYRWTKFCFSKQEDKITRFQINYEDLKESSHLKLISTGKKLTPLKKPKQLKDQFEIPYEPKDQTVLFSHSNNTSNQSFCSGINDRNVSRRFGAIAGITIERSENESLSSSEICGEEILLGNMLKFSTFNLLDANHKIYNITAICWTFYVKIYIKEALNYNDQLKNCNQMKGRLLTYLEINMYRDFLKVDKYNQYNALTWLATKSKKIDGPKYCFIFLNNGHTIREKCFYNAGSLCIALFNNKYYLYGNLTKYNHTYQLRQTENETFMLFGSSSTNITKRKDQWILKMDTRKDETILSNNSTPFGRQFWNNKGSEVLLSLTHCNSSEFACSDGSCIPDIFRCNEVVECLDHSDEEDCQWLVKESGYMKSARPTLGSGEEVFTIFYAVMINNIADISSSDGLVVVDAVISLFWNDPRLVFWNSRNGQYVDCDQIWLPKIGMADQESFGFQLNFDIYSSSCTLYGSNRGNKSMLDPYMGYSVDGNDLQLLYMFSALITIPCRFKLHKYPFGIQTCKIAFRSKNAYLYQPTIFRFINASANTTMQIEYNGPEMLGEFNFAYTNTYLTEDNTTAVIEFGFQTLYGFHLLNSYAPSSLILIISYASLFFPIVNFNERVMVSLTALLVLSSLFNQATEASVKTSYFKFLDVWYVALMTFCFVNVIFHAVLHKLKLYLLKKDQIRKLQYSEDWEENQFKEYEQIHDYSKKIPEINFWFRVILTCCFIIFFVYYCLAAANII